VFQDPFSSLNPRRPIGDAISEPLRVSAVARAERDRRVADVLAAVGLAPGSEARFPRQFSGGQRQRIAIARALVTEPRLVVCDEAVSALDLSTQAQVLNLLADLRSGADLGYLFIAHDMAVVEFLAQRVVVLNRGRVVEEGPTLEVMRNPQQHYTRVLMAASPVPDPDEQARRREAWQALKASAPAA
jgi:peptide/nickel transport system ATP-binding protein